MDSLHRVPAGDTRFLTPRQYWWRLMRWPLLAFAPLALVLATTSVDVAIARGLFFDAQQMRWMSSGDWLVNVVVHTGGRWLIRVVIGAALFFWLATFMRSTLARWRRPSAYFLFATLLTVLTVGALKHLTNTDCPWDLVPFGGQYPYVHLFAHRPSELRAAACFPAAHASSGYALMALYFLLLERNRQWARAGLFVGIGTGLLFGIAQQSRGAHFLSHDLWSAMIAWAIALSLYCFAFGCRVWDRAAPQPIQAATGPAPHS